ncbi:MAG: nucleotidyltransferase family protein [Candidatus Melainabacteria bacterium]|nr:nucleotidyltransferase family protein [Candidatus Melainabacteria bacterium]
MKTRSEVIAILGNHKLDLMQRWQLKSLALFGSVARNEQTETSDIDLLVELGLPMGWEFFDLIAELETLLGSKVDLIERSQIKPKAWHYIVDEVVYV